MGSIDIIKPLSTVLSSAINKYQQHQEKKNWNTPRIKPRTPGWEASLLPLCYEAPPTSTNFVKSSTISNFDVSKATSDTSTEALEPELPAATYQEQDANHGHVTTAELVGQQAGDQRRHLGEEKHP